MKRVIVLLLFLSVLGSCDRKKPPKQYHPTKKSLKNVRFATPSDVVKEYIHALETKDIDNFNSCHSSEMKLKKNTIDYEKLRDALKYIEVLEFKINEVKYLAKRNEAVVKIDWKLSYNSPSQTKPQTYELKNAVIPVVLENDEWLVNPKSGFSFWNAPKITDGSEGR